MVGDHMAAFGASFFRLVNHRLEIAEIEINPLLTFPQATDFRAVDARVRLAGVGKEGV